MRTVPRYDPGPAGAEDRTLTCRQCGASFVFTAAQQRAYREIGFRAPPKRCPPCREKWNQQKLQKGYPRKPWRPAGRL